MKAKQAIAIALLALALTAAQTSAQSAYEAYTFTTLAGGGGSGSADGVGNAAQFNYPGGAAVDSAGNIYVADTQNATIRKVTPTGIVTALAGLAGRVGGADGPGSDARFNYTYGVAVDGAGNVYATDNYTIRKVTPTGVVTTLAGLADNVGSLDGTGTDARFNDPAGVAVDIAGNLYVADYNNHTIRKITPGGVVTTLAGTATQPGRADGTGRDARFAGPSGVALDSAGNVYVADHFNHTIRKITPAGAVTTLAGLAVDDDVGKPVDPGRDATGRAARFLAPQGVAADSAGNVYVADTGNNTIRKVTPTGVVTTLAGLRGSSGSADGTGRNARFSFPSGIAVDGAGTVYVADAGNNTIRKGFPALAIRNSGPGFGFNRSQFGFILTGPPGRLVVVEASTDLVSWLPIWTNTISGALNFVDTQSGVSFNRFYRAHTP